MIYAVRRGGFLAACSVCFLILQLSACSTYHRESSLVYDSLTLRNPNQALLYLESSPRKDRDSVLYHLNKGLLLHMQASYEESNSVFEVAKHEMQRLEATSILENLESVTINEGRRTYAGQSYEKLLLHVYMAINYLMLGNLIEARVEVLQADVKMNEWISSDKIEGIKASAFARYFSGVVFEMNREADNALIAYRKAYQVYTENQFPVPKLLQNDLLKFTEYFNLKDEYEKYIEEFGLGEKYKVLPKKNAAGYGELIYIINSGLVSQLAEHSIDAFSPGFNRYVRVAVPYYRSQRTFLNQSNNSIYINGKQINAEQIEDIDQLARRNLQKRLPAITARAVARAVVKYKVVGEAKAESPLLGLITNVATAMTERADTRSWSILPADISIVRKHLKPGIYKILIPGAGQEFNIEIIDGKKTLIVANASSNIHNIVRH